MKSLLAPSSPRSSKPIDAARATGQHTIAPVWRLRLCFAAFHEVEETDDKGSNSEQRKAKATAQEGMAARQQASRERGSTVIPQEQGIMPRCR